MPRTGYKYDNYVSFMIGKLTFYILIGLIPLSAPRGTLAPINISAKNQTDCGKWFNRHLVTKKT